MTYAEELAAQGLIPIQTLGEYREAFARWGIPNRVIRPEADLGILWKGFHPDAATVFVDDFQDGKPMAVVVNEEGIWAERRKRMTKGSPFVQGIGAATEYDRYVRPVWDKEGFEAWIVLERQRRIDLPGTAWSARVSYGPLMTQVILGDFGGNLKTAKATASNLAREQMFVPKGTWRPVVEED